MIVRKMMLAISCLACVPLLGGCPRKDMRPEIHLYQTTGAPPARKATIHQENIIEISRGVVMGVRCWDSCGTQCFAPHITPADSALLSVRQTYRSGAAQQEYVLIGLKQGRTRLHLTNGCATTSYQVTIVD